LDLEERGNNQKSVTYCIAACKTEESAFTIDPRDPFPDGPKVPLGSLLTVALVGQGQKIRWEGEKTTNSNFNPKTTSLVDAFDTWRREPLELWAGSTLAALASQHPVASLSGITQKQFESEKRTLQNVLEGSLLDTYNESEESSSGTSDSYSDETSSASDETSSEGAWWEGLC